MGRPKLVPSEVRRNEPLIDPHASIHRSSRTPNPSNISDTHHRLRICESPSFDAYSTTLAPPAYGACYGYGTVGTVAVCVPWAFFVLPNSAMAPQLTRSSLDKMLSLGCRTRDIPHQAGCHDVALARQHPTSLLLTAPCCSHSSALLLNFIRVCTSSDSFSPRVSYPPEILRPLNAGHCAALSSRFVTLTWPHVPHPW